MKTQSTTDASLLRIINREVLENDFDRLCYREARRRSDGRVHSAIENYIALRLQALKAVDLDTSVLDLKPPQMLTTDQCHKHLSSRKNIRGQKNSKDRSEKLNVLELWISSIVLLIGSISAALCLWSHTGESLANLPYPILFLVIFVQLIPWVITKLNICTRLTAASALCILIAITSVGSAVKLLKSNPDSKVKAEDLKKSFVQTITIIPASSGVDTKQSTASLSYK